MKKYHAIALSLAMPIVAMADNTVKFSVNDVTITQEELNKNIMVDLNIENNFEFVSFQVFMAMPEGFTSSNAFTVNPDRAGIVYEDEDDPDTQINEKVNDTNWNAETSLLWCAVHDKESRPFTGNSGSVGTFRIKAAADIQPGEYVVKCTEAVAATPEAVRVPAPDFEFKITVALATSMSSTLATGQADIYTLSGVKVMDQPAKGIYIKNGKKVVIK